MALNADRYRKDVESKGSGSGNSNDPTLKLQQRIKETGKTYWRIFKFNHKVTERDYTIGLYRKGDKTAPAINSVSEEISRRMQVHFRSGGGSPVSCFINRANCELCQEAKALRAEGNANKRAANMVDRQDRMILNVVNMNEPEKGMVRLDLSQMPYAGILTQYFSKLEDGATDEDIFGCNGRDFIIEYNKETSDINKKYIVTLRDKERCKQLPAELQSKVIDYYQITAMDPQDAPPVEQKEAHDKMPWEDENGNKKETPEKEPVKTPAGKKPLEDKPTGPKKGSKIFFMDGETRIEGTIDSLETTGKAVVIDGNGDKWGLDKTEYTLVS